MNKNIALVLIVLFGTGLNSFAQTSSTPGAPTAGIVAATKKFLANDINSLLNTQGSRRFHRKASSCVYQLCTNKRIHLHIYTTALIGISLE